MSTSVSWPPIGGTTYSIPASGELNWQALSSFLVAIGGSAQSTANTKLAIRVATTSPATLVSASDTVVITQLSVAGAVAVNLPAGVTGQCFFIVDGTGDAATNNITITPAAGVINGSATYIINKNRAGVLVGYNGTSWTVLSEFTNIASGTIPRASIAPGTANHVVINSGTGALSSEATLAKSRGGTGADNSSVSFPSSGTIPTTGNKLSDFAATTSAELKTVISDETGTGALVFANSPALVTPTGIVKGDVGLGNVDNTSDATKNAASVVLTNKDIDGGTASNTSRVTLPKASTATLSGLTRKEGTVVYDTTLSQPFYDNGSSLVGLASSASAQDSIADAKNYSISCSVASNALTIALKTKAGTDPSAGDSVNIAFRDTTATSGVYSLVSATAATSLVISSGSTLGHTSGVAYPIYVYALNNSGTIEIAASTIPFSELTTASTTAEGGAGAADSDSVLYSTSARTSKALKLLARLVSNQTTAGTWAAVPTLVSTGHVLTRPNSYIKVSGNAGVGSEPSNKITRFNATDVSYGTGVTFSNDSTNGSSFTINEDGDYAISFTNIYNAAGVFGISLNATRTTAVDSLAVANVLQLTHITTASRYTNVSWSGPLRSGDVVRPHQDGSATAATTTYVQFIIKQISRAG